MKPYPQQNLDNPKRMCNYCFSRARRERVWNTCQQMESLQITNCVNARKCGSNCHANSHFTQLATEEW